MLDDAVAELGRLDDGIGLALALLARGNARRDLGAAAAAGDDYAAAAACARKTVGQSWPTGLILAIEAFTLAVGPVPVQAAIARCDEILASIEWGPPGPIGVYSALGVLYAMRGEFETGRSFAARAVAACEEFGLRPVLEGTIRPHAALVDELAGDDERAIEMLELAYERVEECNEPAGIGVAAPRLARLLAARGDAARAGGSLDEPVAALAERAEAVAAPGDIVAAAEWQRATARALAAAGETGRATRAARRAVRSAEPTDFLPLRAGTFLDLAHVLAAAGRDAEAEAAAQQAAALHRAKGDVTGLRAARALASASRPGDRTSRRPASSA